MAFLEQILKAKLECHPSPNKHACNTSILTRIEDQNVTIDNGDTKRWKKSKYLYITKLMLTNHSAISFAKVSSWNTHSDAVISTMIRWLISHVGHVQLQQYGFRAWLIFPSYFRLFLLRASLDQSKTSTKQKTKKPSQIRHTICGNNYPLCREMSSQTKQVK